VYGDTPNRLPLIEQDCRWEVSPEHPFACHGIDETMSIDASTHSVFGVSKVSADLMVQEFGRYFGLKTVCFRGGCITGPRHSGTQLHGFLSYLMKCAVTGQPYKVLGYKGKQVRDNIHSFDLVNAFWFFFKNPRIGQVYNIGGGRHANCSMLEAIALCEELAHRNTPAQIRFKNPRAISLRRQRSKNYIVQKNPAPCSAKLRRLRSRGWESRKMC
jgi:CDP-paratose 2-epimerase